MGLPNMNGPRIGGIRLPSLRMPSTGGGANRVSVSANGGGLKLPGLPGLPRMISRVGKDIDPGIPETAPNNQLTTETSTLGKVMNFINRPTPAIDGGLIAGMTGGNVLDAMKQGITGNSDVSGAEVIRAATGMKPPTTRLGGFAQAAAGIALDVLNPINPLNWIGIGELSKAGKIGMETAEKVPGIVEGLLNGTRTAGSVNVPLLGRIAETPEFVDKMLGHTLSGAGDVINSVPGVKPVFDMFKKPLTDLAPIGARQTSEHAGIVAEQMNSIKAPVLAKVAGTAIGKIKSGEFDAINPGMALHYKNAGYNPEQIFTAETRRLQEAPILENQVKNGINWKTDDPEVANRLSTAIKSIPVSGETLPEIKTFSDETAKSLASTSNMKVSRGLEGELPGYTPRPLSTQMVQRMKDLGIKTANGERVLKDLTSEQAETIARDPNLRGDFYSSMLGTGGIKNNPGLLDKLRKTDPMASTMYESNYAKAFGKNLDKSAKEISTADAVKDIAANPSFARAKASDWEGSGENDIVKVDVDPKHSEWIKSGLPEFDGKSIYMPANIAPQFRKVSGLLSSPVEMNKMIQAMEKVQNVWKQTTLFSFPGTFARSSRDLLSGRIQAYIQGALSPQGESDALKLVNAFRKSGGIPSKVAEEAAKMGPLGEHLDFLNKNNLFSAGQGMNEWARPASEGLVKTPMKTMQKYIGVPIGQRWTQLTESSNRAQHYMTRINQGWSKEAALEDAMKYQYNYANLPDAVKALRIPFPFFSWTYNNIPAMVEGILRHPGKFALPERVKQNIESTTGLQADGGKPDENALDEFVKGQLHFRLWQDPKTGTWTYARLATTIPQGELENFITPGNAAKWALGNLTPLAKVPLETALNKSFFFSGPGGEPSSIERFPGETAPFLGMNMNKKVINALKSIRPANEVQRFIPQEGKSTLDIPSQAARYAGVQMTPVDLNKANVEGQYQFKQAWDNYKNAFIRAKARGDQQNMNLIRQGFQQLLQNSQPSTIALPGKKR